MACMCMPPSGPVTRAYLSDLKDSLRPSHLESSITDQQLAYVKPIVLSWQ